MVAKKDGDNFHLRRSFPLHLDFDVAVLESKTAGPRWTFGMGDGACHIGHFRWFLFSWFTAADDAATCHFLDS
jgi:hypothetical protein